jgi:hypothetical protein
VVDHVTIYRWVLRFTPLLADAARPCRHRVGDRWQVDETYVRVAGRWRYVYRAIDQFRQVIDVFVASRRDTKAAIASSNRPSVRRRSRRLRSSPIRRRCTRRCWKTCCRRPGTAPTATPTIGSSATWETEGAAGSDAWAQPGPPCQGDHLGPVHIREGNHDQFQLHVHHASPSIGDLAVFSGSTSRRNQQLAPWDLGVGLLRHGTGRPAAAGGGPGRSLARVGFDGSTSRGAGWGRLAPGRRRRLR